MGDSEGINGLPFVSANDPRTASMALAGGVRFPTRQNPSGTDPITIASGVEAQLVVAEYELSKGNVTEWLRILNQLRTTGSFTITENPTDPALRDTTWAPGSGAILFLPRTLNFPGLRPLEDPGTPESRITLQFRERAFWLYLTGHRQGDLRRLIRQYNRPELQVYPVGRWGPLAAMSYGTDSNIPVPVHEQLANKLYTGCIDRDA